MTLEPPCNASARSTCSSPIGGPGAGTAEVVHTLKCVARPRWLECHSAWLQAFGNDDRGTRVDNRGDSRESFERRWQDTKHAFRRICEQDKRPPHGRTAAVTRKRFPETCPAIP